MNNTNQWWSGILPGIVPLGLGLYLLISPTGATFALGLLAAIYLLVAGLIHAYRGLQLRPAGEGNVIWIRGLVALITGAVLLGMELLDVGTLTFAYTVLAIGLILYGALGLFTEFFQRGGREFEWGPILVSLLLLAWGALVFYSRSREFDLANVSGWVLTAIGAILLIWTFLSRPRDQTPASV